MSASLPALCRAVSYAAVAYAVIWIGFPARRAFERVSRLALLTENILVGNYPIDEEKAVALQNKGQPQAHGAFYGTEVFDARVQAEVYLIQQSEQFFATTGDRAFVVRSGYEKLACHGHIACRRGTSIDKRDPKNGALFGLKLHLLALGYANVGAGFPARLPILTPNGNCTDSRSDGRKEQRDDKKNGVDNVEPVTPLGEGQRVSLYLYVLVAVCLAFGGSTLIVLRLFKFDLERRWDDNLLRNGCRRIGVVRSLLSNL